MTHKTTIKMLMLHLTTDCGMCLALSQWYHYYWLKWTAINNDSQQCGIQEDATCRVDFISGCKVGDEGDNDDIANTATN